MKRTALIFALCLVACHRRIPEPPHHGPPMGAMRAMAPTEGGYLETTTCAESGALPIFLRTLDDHELDGKARGAYRKGDRQPIGGTYADGGLVPTQFNTTHVATARAHPSDPCRFSVLLSTGRMVRAAKYIEAQCASDAAANPACTQVATFAAVESSLDSSWSPEDAGLPYWTADGGAGVMPQPPDDYDGGTLP